MCITTEKVQNILSAFEPDYAEPATLLTDALVQGETLIKSSDAVIASRAIRLTSLIQDGRSLVWLKFPALGRLPHIRFKIEFDSRYLKVSRVDEILVVRKRDNQEHNIKHVENLNYSGELPSAIAKCYQI